MVKNPPANAGGIRDTGSIPGSGRSPGGGHGNLLQYSCLENAMDREVWWATIHRVAKSWIGLKGVSMHVSLNGTPEASSASENLLSSMKERCQYSGTKAVLSGHRLLSRVFCSLKTALPNQQYWP